jgi:2-oxoglutarate ferredoxin oxidoreductase subunit delta
MAGKIAIDCERCKGCGLCMWVCSRDGIVMSKNSNKAGYFPAEVAEGDCTGCGMCAIVCPEAIIEVYRDEHRQIEATPQPSGKAKSVLAKERA